MTPHIAIETRNFILKPSSIWMIASIFLALTLSIVTVIVFPQKNLLSSFLIVIFSSLWLTITFSFSKLIIISRVEKFFIRNKIEFSIIVHSLMFITYFLISLIGNTLTISTFGIFFLFYIIPVALLLFSQYLTIENSFRTMLIIFGVLILWIGMDHRYTMDLFDGYDDLSYHLTTLWLVQILFVTYTPFNIKSFNQVNSKPTLSGIKYTLLLIPILFAILIPTGFKTGFIFWSPDFETSPLLKFATFLVIYLTIALPEEFIFRGIILHEFDKKIPEGSPNRILSLILVSFLFGLTHWNNISLALAPYYFLFATIAGLAYGYVWRKSGLFAAALLHTSVDWIWAFYFQ